MLRTSCRVAEAAAPQMNKTCTTRQARGLFVQSPPSRTGAGREETEHPHKML
jgi:hypothetical protein